MNRGDDVAERSGVMLVGHGTRDPEGTREFFQLGERLRARLAPQPVESCLLEFQQPTIAQSWRTLVERGTRHIHVAPLLLFAAGHAKQDIPDIVAGCRAETPGVTFDQSRPLSRHPSLVELVTRRISETLESEAMSSLSQAALVMVGRGNRDPCAQADMRVLSEVVSRRLPFGKVRTAFYAMAEPRLREVLDQVVASGRYRTIIVHPHLLFTGRLHEAIGRQVVEASQRHRRVRFRLSGYLGPEPEVAAAIAGRIQK